MRNMVIAAMCLACLTGARPAEAQIVNGSFEPAAGIVTWALVAGGLSTIPGWETTDYGVEWVLGTSGGAPAPDGLHVVDLATYVWSAGGIQQTFATIPGEAYTIIFQLGTLQASGRDGTCEIIVDADAQSQAFSHVNHSGVITYAEKIFVFLADDTSATLRFRCLQNANLHFAYLDAVGMGAVVGEETSAWGEVKASYR